MSCYFIAQINIHDKDEYSKYLEQTDEVFEKFKGEVVAVDDAVSILEGEWPYERTVLIRFPDKKELERWYYSEAYQKIAQHRWNGSSANIVAVQGRV
jgi:uncharacterized protein (DUF1330 family)